MINHSADSIDSALEVDSCMRFSVRYVRPYVYTLFAVIIDKMTHYRITVVDTTQHYQ